MFRLFWGLNLGSVQSWLGPTEYLRLNTWILYRKLLSSHFLTHQSVIRSTYLQLFSHFPCFYRSLELKGKRNSTFLTSLMTVENVYWTDESGRPHSTQSFTLHSGCTGCCQNTSGELSGFSFWVSTEEIVMMVQYEITSDFITFTVNNPLPIKITSVVCSFLTTSQEKLLAN